MRTKQEAVATVRRVVRLATTRGTAESEYLRQKISETLLACVKQDYETKARGGTDSIGESWEETNDSRNGDLIMIKSGALLDSIRVEESPDGFTIKSDLEYAKYAFRKRPAWPEDAIPDVWFHKMTTAARKAIRSLIEKELRA